MGLPAGTLTFLFTDIERSTQLWEQAAGEMAVLLTRHDAVMHQAVETWQGHVFKTVGDGFHAVFARPTDAVAAAFEAQRAFGRDGWGALERLPVRMALHTGMAQERDQDYFGPTLNRVARLLDVCHGGQIVLSQTVYDLVRDGLGPDMALADLGLHQLRDLGRPEQVFALHHPELPVAFPPLRSLNVLPNNLPRQLTSFVGRDAEIARVKALLSGASLLTLVGVGGGGKTRLALQVAAQLLEAYPEGAWLVELDALFEPALVLDTIGATFGLTEEPGRPLLPRLRDWLRPRSLLLILDCCEHVISACARAAESLLKTCPNLRILATSREPLGIAGEQTWQVPSLSLPAVGRVLPLKRLVQSEAVHLFLDRAESVAPRFQMTGKVGPAVAQICSRLDGIPLAIELAAALVPALPPEQIAARLDDRFRLLNSGNRTALPRQQTLKAAVDWSHDLLSEAERMLWRRLSVFAGGWSLAAAEGVCADAALPERDILSLLSQLVRKSLALLEPLPRNEGRYRFLEPIREYGRDRLQEQEESESLRDRHLCFFVSLAECAEPLLQGAGQAEWIDRLESDHDNLRAALDWSLNRNETLEAGLRLAGALWRFWQVRGHQSEGRERLALLLERSAGLAPTAARARALVGAGCLARNQDDYTAAKALLEQSLAIRRELPDPQGIADSLHHLGLVAIARGDYPAAQTLIREALAMERDAQDQAGVAASLNALGEVARFEGDFAAAQGFYEESWRIYRTLGDRRNLSITQSNLGAVALAQGDYAKAWPLLSDSLALKRELGAKRGVAETLYLLGRVAALQGEWVSAGRLFSESLTANWKLKEKWGIAYCLEGLAWVAAAGDHSARAAALFGAAAALRRTIGAPLPPSERIAYERTVEEARASLGPDAFDPAWQQGEALPLDQAVALALQASRNADGAAAPVP